MTITLAYKSVDGVSERKTFATLAGARRYAGKRVGLDAEAWGVRATSVDGIGVLTLVEVMKEPPIAPFEIRDMEALLRGKPAPVRGQFEVWTDIVDEDAGTSRPSLVGTFTMRAEADKLAEEMEAYADGVRVYDAGTADAPKWTPGDQSDPY